jgi:hypothetical protein
MKEERSPSITLNTDLTLGEQPVCQNNLIDMKSICLFFLSLPFFLNHLQSQTNFSFEDNYIFQKNEVDESFSVAEIILNGIVEKQEYGILNNEVVTFNYIQSLSNYLFNVSDKQICLVTLGGIWDGYVIEHSHGAKLHVGQKGIIVLDSFTIKEDIILANLGFNNRFFADNGSKDHFTKFFYAYRYAQELALNYEKTLTIDESRLCLKFDNILPDFINNTLSFDILAKTNYSVPLSKIIADCTYPVGNLSTFLVQNSKIQVYLGDSLNSNTYYTVLNDVNDTTVKISLLPFSSAGINDLYNLKTTYTKLLKITINVQNWGNLGNLSINEFEISGQAYYRDDIDLPFDELCTENGEINFGLCEIYSTQTAPFAAGIKQVIELTGFAFGNSGIIEIPNADVGGMPPFILNSTDTRYIKNWSDNSILINITDLTPSSPMGSGLWVIKPAHLTTKCSVNVKVDYAITNQYVSDHPEVGEKMVSIATDLTNGDDRIKWYFNRSSFDASTKLAAQGITSSQILTILQDVFCDWETATGIEIFYAGETVLSNNNLDKINVVLCRPLGGSLTAVTRTYYLPTAYCNPNIPFIYNSFEDIDMSISDEYLYHVGSESSLPLNKLDLYSILIHEVGHFLSLHHAMQGVMYYQPSVGIANRNIDPDAISGVNKQKQRTLDAIGNACFPNHTLNISPQGCTVNNIDNVIESDIQFINYNDNLYVQTSESIAQINIFAINGTIFQTVKDTPNVNISNLPIGIYIAEVYTPSKKVAFKFIKL